MPSAAIMPAQIFRGSLDADEEHLLAGVGGFHRALGVEINAAGSGARPGGQAAGNDFGRL